MHNANCKNCDAPLTSNFCANCGQKADIHRVTLGHFVHEFFHAFTHTDKGILLLMKELVIRPGYVAKEYLEGKRKKYFNPLSFLVILSSAYAYVSHKTGYFEALTRVSQQTPRGGAMYKEVMDVMLDNGKIIALFLMPLLMSFFSWIFFRRTKNNLAENLVLNSFVMGQIYIVMIVIFVPGFLLFPETIRLNNFIFHALMWIYMVVAYRQFFKGNVFLAALKSFLIVILFMFSFWFCIWGYVMVKHALFS